jgi:D-alanyl-D-alanine carboxypeptidase
MQMKRSGQTTFKFAAAAGAAMFTLGYAGLAAADDNYAAVVMDARTNEILLDDQADEARFPASLTKMMTLYMLFEALERGDISLSTRLTASRAASRMPASRLGLRRGDTLTVEQAINALVVQSANDVAVVVAERLGGTESRFASLMTARAREMGMTGTRFVNASGLPDTRQQSSARDMALLGQALWRDFPQNYHYFQTAGWTYRNRYTRGHNRLIGSVEGVDGIKTGYTRASGFNLVSSAERGGRRVIVVVMGGDTAAARDAQVAYLIEGAFEEYARRDLDPNGVTYANLPVNRLDVQLAPSNSGVTTVARSTTTQPYANELGLAPGLAEGSVVETLGPSRGPLAAPIGEGDDSEYSTEETE